MAYLDHFGLSQEPFSNAPVTHFYFETQQHLEAMERLQYAVENRKGLAVLVGDIGAGKTTLARRLLESLPPEEYEAALLVIVHGALTANWLLKRLALQLGVEQPAEDKLTLLTQLYQRLLEIDSQGRKAIVLIDEAQMLETREIMEEFRGLLNLELPDRKLLTFVFFGLPNIEQNLQLDPPLAQRVALRFWLQPFEEDDTCSYVEHRMALAGAPPDVFSAQALKNIHDFSRGSPRLINTLCDNALLEAFLMREYEVKGELIERVAGNLGLATRSPFDVEAVDRYLDGLEKM